jgi:hypothetical protein
MTGSTACSTVCLTNGDPQSLPHQQRSSVSASNRPAAVSHSIADQIHTEHNLYHFIVTGVAILCSSFRTCLSIRIQQTAVISGGVPARNIRDETLACSLCRLNASPFSWHYMAAALGKAINHEYTLVGCFQHSACPSLAARSLGPRLVWLSGCLAVGLLLETPPGLMARTPDQETQAGRAHRSSCVTNDGGTLDQHAQPVVIDGTVYRAMSLAQTKGRPALAWNTRGIGIIVHPGHIPILKWREGSNEAKIVKSRLDHWHARWPGFPPVGQVFSSFFFLSFSAAGASLYLITAHSPFGQ